MKGSRPVSPTVPPAADASVAEKLAALSNPATYGPDAGAVQLIETHFAWIFRTQTRAFKLKKPIRAPDLDLETPQQRFRNCTEELRLNRELSPEVYVGLTELVRGMDGNLRLGGEGVIVDWLVQMQRLPDEQMLDRAIAVGCVPVAAVDSVARLLTGFYRRQTPVALAPQAYVHRLAAQIEANRQELQSVDLQLDASRVARLAVAQQAALRSLHVEVAERAHQHRIIEVHGDLRPEHICLASPPSIIDRLEFSRDLRVMDPCEELAYLSVECSQLGAAWVGERIMAVYRAAMTDPIPDALIRLYQSHRAATRAKIVAWHQRDPDFRARQPWPIIAGRYLAYAQACLSEPATR
jgi:uncharacterized protein